MWEVKRNGPCVRSLLPYSYYYTLAGTQAVSGGQNEEEQEREEMRVACCCSASLRGSRRRAGLGCTGMLFLCAAILVQCVLTLEAVMWLEITCKVYFLRE